MDKHNTYCIDNKIKTITFNLSKFYSDLNNLELNLLDNTNLWFICNKTNELYLFNLIIDNKSIIPLEQNLSTRLTENFPNINKTTYKQINFELKEFTDINDRRSFIYVINFVTQYFGIKNIGIESKTIENKKRKFKQDDTKSLDNFLQKQVVTEQQKKRRINIEDNIWKDMVAASTTRNYLLNDPIIDYLQKFNGNTTSNLKTTNTKSYKSDMFTNYIMNAGVEFERELINLIKKNHDVVQVAESYEAKNVGKFNKTVELMKKGANIIYQAVLHNYDNKTFGVPDLLVRSDYINKLLGYDVISKEEEHIKAIKLKTDWHYKVIDIKHSVINLKANGKTILNSDSIPAYKGQLYVYTEALNKIQGITINKAFIWGKKYQWESCKKKI